jgi:hypothetical protein
LLLLNYDVSEAVLHLETVEGHLVLLLVIVVDRGARTVVPLEPQIHAFLEVLASLGKGLVGLFPSRIDNRGLLNDRLQAAGVVLFTLAVVRLKSLLQLLRHARGTRCGLPLVVLSIRHASRHLLVEGRQVPYDVFLLHLPQLPLLLGASLLILDLVLQVLVVAE